VHTKFDQTKLKFQDKMQMYLKALETDTLENLQIPQFQLLHLSEGPMVHSCQLEAGKEIVHNQVYDQADARVGIPIALGWVRLQPVMQLAGQRQTNMNYLLQLENRSDVQLQGRNYPQFHP